MNLQEVFKKIEMALTPSQDATPEVQEVQEEVKVEMATMKLAGGVVVEAESFEAGENVFLLGEDDEKVAAPVGEHELEDGRILVIVEEGVISEIREAGVEEVVEEEATEEAMEEQEMAYVSKEEFTAAIDEIKEMIAGMMPKEEQSADEVSEEIKEEEKVEMSADEAPAAKKVAAAPVEKAPEMHKFANKGRQDALARVLSKLS
jgi:CRP-like cAMP-binding protein